MSTDAPDQDGQQSGGLSLDRALSAVRRKAKYIVLCTVVATGLGAAFAMMLPNRYDASATIQLDPRTKTISNIDSVLSDLKADTATVESEVEIIRSRNILLKVIDALKLREDDEFKKKVPLIEQIKYFTGAAPITAVQTNSDTPRKADPDRIAELLGTGNPAANEPERDPVALALLDRVKVSRVRTTLLIEIKVSARDPVKAARIANAIAEFYLQDQVETKRQAQSFASGILDDKLGEMRAKLTIAERRVEEFKAEHNIFDAEGQILSEKQLARHMEQTVIARNAVAEAKAKYDQAKRIMAGGAEAADVTPVLESHTIRLMKEALGKATQRQAELMTKYGDKHPEILKVRAEVNDARNQLDEEIRRLVDNIKNEYDIAVEREQQLAGSMGGLKDNEIEAKAATVRLNELQREALTQKQLFEALLSRYKQTTETQDLQLPDSRIVEHADVPLFPAAPKRKQLVALSFAGGLGLALLLVLALEFGTSGIVRGDDVERELAVTHLGSLPSTGSDDVISIDPVRSVRMMLAEPHGAFADAVRAARREIDERRPSQQPRVILVTSSLPNEGTNVIASNLAHHYALTGSRVLLIDGDMRRGVLTRQLAPSRQAGLLDILTHGVHPEQAILHDAGTGLCFLPAISQMPLELSSPEVLASAHMQAVLNHLKYHFDTIIIDTPPLLPVMDGRMLADLADQIVFAMTWRRTPKQLARRAFKALGLNQRKITGLIISQVDPGILRETQGLGSIGPARDPILRRAA